MRIPVRAENGWQIDAILDTTYEATKDGESVTLEADTLEQMELLIALREGNVKHEDQPRATITMPDSFRCVPAADVKPVKRGNWVDKERHEHYPSGKPYTARYCGVCGKRDHNEDGDFCGYCGADMREEIKDE